KLVSGDGRSHLFFEVVIRVKPNGGCADDPFPRTHGKLEPVSLVDVHPRLVDRALGVEHRAVKIKDDGLDRQWTTPFAFQLMSILFLGDVPSMPGLDKGFCRGKMEVWTSIGSKAGENNGRST